MKRNYHKLLILIFSLMTVWMVAFPTEAAAYSPRISISNNTIMYVSGEGDAESSIIWSSLDRTTIKEIVVERGITGLGDRIFRGFSNVTSVEIASTVTHIGMEAFNGCSSLGELPIPASVTKIGDYAFAQCTALYYIGLAKGLESIGSYAFSDCVSLPKVSLPASLNQIGDNIFSGCQKLTEIALQYGSTSFSVQDKVLFNANGTVLIAYPKGLGLQIASGGQPSGLYQVPEGTLIIGKYAFAGCNGLLDVTLPESVQTIENNAFVNCQNLQAVTIPKSVTSIGAGSFYNCPNLTIYGEHGSYAQTYANSNNIPFKELQGPQLEISDRSISVSVIGMPTYEQQVAAARTLTVTNLSERPVKVETQMYKGEYPVDGASAVFWPGNPVATLNQGESLKHTVTPREVRCGRYEYSLHVFANDELYAEVPVYITFTHNPSLVVGVRPTCTVDGVREHYKCYICNRLFWDRECTQPVANISETVIPALGHDWDEPTYSWSEENTQARATRVCQRDPSHIDTETVDTKYEEIMKPTCTTMGIGVYTAVFENPAFQEQTKKVDIPALGHDWSDWEVIDEPTCEEPGHNVRYCYRCNDFEVEEIPALGHDWDEPMYSWSEDYTEARAECICKRDRSHVLIETVPTKYEEIAKPTCTTIGIGVYTAVFKNPAFKEQTMRVEIPALGHDWGDWVGKEKPTCEKPGLNVRFCSRCDAVETEEIPALGHEWGEPVYLWSEDNKQVDALCRCERDSSHVLTETAYTEYTVTKEPTCEEEGVGTYRAAFINKVFWGQTKDVPIPPLGHDYGEPTYTWSEDNTKVRAQVICKRDPSHVITEEVDTEYTVTLEPTCEEEGIGTYTAGFEHKIFWGQTKDVKIPALGHDWGEPKYTWSDDYKKATAECVCKRDPKHVLTETVDTEYIVTKEPTCEEEGVGTYRAGFINKIFWGQTKDVPIPPLGHDYGEPTYTWSEDNTKVRAQVICKRDPSHVIEEEVDTEYSVTKEPTCTEEGIGTYTAGFEHKIFWGQTKDVKIPALGHNYKEVEGTAIKPTCTEDGKEADQQCTRCKDLIKGKVIPALGHKEEVIPAVDPTCTKDGFTEGKKCSVCGALLEEPKVVPALGHDWDEPTYTWSEDNAQVTAECVCKRDPTHVITETVDTELTVTKKPTCTEDGLGTYTAGFINKIFWGQTKEAAIPATGHSWDQGVVTTPPTTTAEGVKTYTCTACGATRTETIPKLTPAADPVLGTVTTLDGKAKALSENGDPAGSSFSILQVKGKKVKKTSITIAWKPVPKAAGYVVYGAPCGSKYTKLRDIAGTSFKQSSLKKGKYYKYFVAAHDKNGNILATSKTVHIATTGGKKGNTKSVKLNKKKASLKVGKTFKLKAKLKNGKLKVKNHRKVAYETDNPKVATVSKSGKIKAVGKGTCYVYAYAQNGVFARCRVTVK